MRQSFQSTQEWLTFATVDLLGTRHFFLLETHLSFAGSWRGTGRRCSPQNQGWQQILFILYSLFAWQIRPLHPVLEFSGRDAACIVLWRRAVTGWAGHHWPWEGVDGLMTLCLDWGLSVFLGCPASPLLFSKPRPSVFYYRCNMSLLVQANWHTKKTWAPLSTAQTTREKSGDPGLALHSGSSLLPEMDKSSFFIQGECHCSAPIGIWIKAKLVYVIAS